MAANETIFWALSVPFTFVSLSYDPYYTTPKTSVLEVATGPNSLVTVVTVKLWGDSSHFMIPHVFQARNRLWIIQFSLSSCSQREPQEVVNAVWCLAEQSTEQHSGCSEMSLPSPLSVPLAYHILVFFTFSTSLEDPCKYLGGQCNRDESILPSACLLASKPATTTHDRDCIWEHYSGAVGAWVTQLWQRSQL